MGTINYRTSDYITLGVKPYTIDEIMNDCGFIEYARDEWRIDPEDENALYEAASREAYEYYFDDKANVKSIMNKYSFYYYHVTIEPGYYEGFSLNIENNYPVAFDSWEDKREAQKEIT